MSSKTVSDQLVTMLVQAGVKRVYAVTGDSLNFVNDAIRRSGAIEWIHVRNEETGAFAAGAEAQLDGIACCAGSSGPGHVHLLNGLYDAHKSSASVIAIASTCHSSEFGTDSFQETNTIKLFDDCSCYNQVAVTPLQFSRMFQATIQHAIHKKGVAVIGLPGDLTNLRTALIDHEAVGQAQAGRQCYAAHARGRAVRTAGQHMFGEHRRARPLAGDGHAIGAASTQQAGELVTGLGAHPSVRIAPITESFKHSVKDILQESLSHEKEALDLYKELLTTVEDSSVYLEEFARTQIGQEELHGLELRKMLRDIGVEHAAPVAARRKQRR